MNIFNAFFFEFNRGSKPAEAAQNICAVYGKASIAERTAQKWFAHSLQAKAILT
jgi:hypothetical protein